jgi:hypothetical protein
MATNGDGGSVAARSASSDGGGAEGRIEAARAASCIILRKSVEGSKVDINDDLRKL